MKPIAAPLRSKPRPARSGRGTAPRLASGGIDVVVNERRVPTIDPEAPRSVPTEREGRRPLAPKSGDRIRTACEPLAVSMIVVETPGATGSDAAVFPYRRARRPISSPDTRGRFLD